MVRGSNFQALWLTRSLEDGCVHTPHEPRRPFRTPPPLTSPSSQGSSPGAASAVLGRSLARRLCTCSRCQCPPPPARLLARRRHLERHVYGCSCKRLVALTGTGTRGSLRALRCRATRRHAPRPTRMIDSEPPAAALRVRLPLAHPKYYNVPAVTVQALLQRLDSDPDAAPRAKLLADDGLLSPPPCLRRRGG